MIIIIITISIISNFKHLSPVTLFANNDYDHNDNHNDDDVDDN